MPILSPIMSYIVDNEVGFPIPSEKEKINKALKRYRYILSQHPNRSDAPEIMFGLADLLVGRGEENDYKDALKFYDHILLRLPPDYLKARALIGKAELLIGNIAEADNAISLCEKARKLLDQDLSDFFAAKTYIVEAELLLSRKNKGDWANAINLINRIVRQKRAHWYFRGRALLAKAEIVLYRKPNDLKTPLKLVDLSIKELESRPGDYFTIKGKVLRAEIMTWRAKSGDFFRAEKLLSEVIKAGIAYQDLEARAKINLANIANNPKATQYLKQVLEMDGLDPYLIEKARNTQATIKEKQALKKKKKAKKAKNKR